jgi:hypothetical protein
MRFVLALALLLAGCNEKDPPLDDHSAILPFSEMPTYDVHGKTPYAPSNKDILRFRAALPGVLPASMTVRLPTYYGQFIGYIDDEDGHRWIHGNFKCKVDDLDKWIGHDWWKHHYVRTNDGGDCFFNVEWSPETDATRQLQINGDA